MNNQFDELTKRLSQSVTLRGALKKFRLCVAGMALACFGLTSRLIGQTTCLPSGYHCKQDSDCCSGQCHTFKIGGKLNTKACL